MYQAWQWVLAGYGVMSAVTFACYGFDKRRAVRQGRRLRERTLHGLELLGGWPGALAGQAVFKHKRRKGAYMAVFAAIVAVHVVGWVAYVRLIA
jgi:uncharacterized membrane protein YsdA (DUF1294 family)